MCGNSNQTELIALHKKLSESLNCTIGISETEMLLKHLRFVLKVNQTINLTSITDENSGRMLHIEDSLTALPEVASALPGKLVDMGSGGGFPGMPLAIVSRREVTLVESAKKKAAVLERFIKENDMGALVEVKAIRIEELAILQRGVFAVATARALTSLSGIMELAAPLLITGGLLIAYKGKLSEREILGARNAEELLGMEMKNRREIVLSDGETKRELLIFKKVEEAKIKLPRKSGKAQKHPLC